MRILHVNKFLYRRGGAEAYALDLAALQRDAGHEIAFFSTSHAENEPSRFDAHFPSYIELNPPPATLSGRARAAARMLYSSTARAGMESVIRFFRPDVVHLHNIYHHLSPSILRPLKRRSIPTVMTLHDFKLACPTHRFMAHGNVCEACLGGHFHQAIVKRCNEGSLGASALNAVELALHTYTGAYDPIHLFLCPSRFMQRKMEDARVFPERLRLIPHFIDAAAISLKEQPGGGIAYAGRFSEEKGVDVLVEAAARLDEELHLIGDGPMRPALESLARRLDMRNVHFHGHVPLEEVHRIIRSSSVTAMPSRGYENMPIAILESFACGVPVVGTDHGGIPELIEVGVDGALAPPNDPDGLAAALRPILEDPARAFEMGRAGRAKVQERSDPGRHLELVDRSYDEAADLAARSG